MHINLNRNKFKVVCRCYAQVTVKINSFLAACILYTITKPTTQQNQIREDISFWI